MVDLAQRLANLSPAQQELLKSRLKSKPQVSQPIAIVGMSCRLPGADNLDEFWRLIAEQRTAVTEIPEERWDVDHYYDPDPDTPGKMAIRWGAFINKAREFDSMFFGITPREAVRMDPQQRLLLEVTWEAFENAGISAEKLAGSSTGVFVGIGGSDYSKLPSAFDNYLDYIDAHMGTGNALSVAANRISYVMDLRGPSLAIDTACSSGLVGLHMAVQSLRNGDCDSAVAGAVNMVLSPEVSIAFSKARMLSMTGECRPFDAAANGYVRGEGCGMLVLKRLTDAAKEGDEILGVIRGTAINQDGRTSGITAPNSLSQIDCIKTALSKAGLSTGKVNYIEAHGTGTPLGDPIEFQSLTKLFPKRSENDKPVFVTSAKANVGHTETVSGIVGLIKVLLIMKHGVIPGQALLEELNPNINLDGTRLQIPRTPVDVVSDGPFVAGISSFGFGGTNSHVIVESAAKAAPESSNDNCPERPQHVLAFSAKSKSAAPVVAERLAERLESLSDEAFADFCHSANVGRSHFNHRTAIVADSRTAMIESLRKAADGKHDRTTKAGEVRIAVKPKIAFLFTGQGSQYANMAHALYEKHPEFRRWIDECNRLLEPHRDHSLLSVIYPQGGETPLNETAYTQPAIFAIEYALAKLWRSWGVEPSVLIGHSVGEYVAACVSGVFSLEDGLALLAKRAELMQRLPQNGKMAVIFASRDRVNETIEPLGGQVAVATANGPENNVISGEAELVDQAIAEFEKAGIGTQLLKVSHAFHSPLMDPMLDEFESYAAGLEYNRPTIPIVANRTGKLAGESEFDPSYWRDHIRNAVEFEMSMKSLEEFGVHAMLEIGPTASLVGMGRRCLPDSTAAWVPSLRKGRDDWGTLLGALSELYVLGVGINWKAVDAPWRRRRISLPTYPFQRSSHWLLDARAPITGGGGTGPSLHPLVGSRYRTAFESELFESRYSVENPKHLRDHQVQGSVVVPAAAYIEQGLGIANLQFGEGIHAIENIAIQAAMFLPVEGHRIVQVTASPEMGGRSTFETLSVSGESNDDSPKWQLHASGAMVHSDSVTDTELPSIEKLDDVRARQIRRLTKDEFYDIMARRNLDYGPSFQVLREIVRTEVESVAELDLPPAVAQDLGNYHLHPALGDALMQCVAGTVPPQPNGDFAPYTYVPVRIKRARVFGNAADGTHAFAKRISKDDQPSPEVVESDVFLVDANEKVIAAFEGVTIQRVGKPIDATGSVDVNEWLYEIGWQAAPFESAETSLSGRFVIFADDTGFGASLAEKVSSAGGTPMVVRLGESVQIGESESTIRPTESEDFKALLASAMEDGQPVTCVHAWTLHAGDDDSSMTGLRDHGVASIMRLTQQAARITSGKPPQLWVVTRSAHAIVEGDTPVAAQSPSVGLVRVAGMEHPELGCRLVDIAGDNSAMADNLIQELANTSHENQIAYRGDDRYVARLESKTETDEDAAESDTMQVPSNGPFRLRITTAGSFDSLYYEKFELTPPPAGSVQIEVKATGLNFSDVLKAMGLYPGITDAIVPMGIEASGVVTAVGEGVDRFQVGDEVMGVAPYSFASHATTAEYALVKKPANISHEEASTIPITFLTAYYGLVRLAGMTKGERVLIHAGAGGVGQAAIQIAKFIGAEIFATAGSDEKRDFLRSLGVDHVMNSRTLEFADEIREITNREGVDIVLNSLPGDAITESLGVLRAYGRFLEIGKTDIYSNTMIGLLPFQDNLSYFAIDLDRMLRQRPDYIRTMFAEMMQFFEDGTYNPMAFTRFNSEQTIDAYRYMAQRKNIGKVVVSVERSEGSDDDFVATFKPSQEGTYLITGGLGALGLQVADWLADRGAGHVALMSRRSPDETKQQSIQALESKGIRVVAVQGDVTDKASLETAINQIPGDFSPLKGVIHAAGVLADGVMFDMDLDQLDKPLGSKVHGTWNLHQATKDQDLDCFVLFSSIASVLGSPGQSNYAAGNAYLDGMAAMRQANGLPGVSINWGPWANSGMATEEGREEQLASRGMGMLPAEESLDLMGDLIAQNQPATAVMAVNWVNLVRANGGNVAPLLAKVAADVEVGSRGDSAEDRAFRKMIGELSVADRNEKLTEFFAGQLARIMGMELEDIEVATPLNAMGLDSLMAIELKNKIESQLQMSLPMAVFMNEPSVATIAAYVAENFGKDTSDSESNGQAT